MTLTPGSRLGPYEITGKLGEGGMGVVFKAKDFQLGRDVALKVLPEGFTADPERVARFEREAKLLAQLNHPNIAQIYGLETSGETRALVMELVEGPTLAERLAAGPLPLAESLSVSFQIALALEEAHEKGIVHRDLKPQNVKASIEGKVKVLDFGLAKALETTPASGMSASELGHSPTITLGATREGMILGTAAYMAPEQAKGLPIDKRVDIWAFGVVLFEMLTAERLFRAATVAETLSAVLTREVDLSRLPERTPAAIGRLLRRCLERNPRNRLHDIADARIVIEEVLGGRDEERLATATGSGLRLALPWGLATLLALVAGMALWSPRRSAPPLSAAVRRYVIPVPFPPPIANVYRPNATAVALAPDGSRLAYVAHDAHDTRLDLQSLDELAAKPLPGTQGASAPFFSPDGRWLGFFAERKLKKLDLVSGDVVTLCVARFPWGGSWSGEEIFFTPVAIQGIWKVAARGGEPSLVAAPDFDHGERGFRFPQVLPGGKALLFTLGGARTDSAVPYSKVGLLDLATGERRILVEDGSNARYAASGHLVYVRDRALLAAPFDLALLEVTGPAVPMDIDLLTDPYTAAAQFALAGDGTLVYLPGDTALPAQQLVWVRRNGEERPLSGASRLYSNLSLSPEGQRLAVGLAEAGNMDVWVDDLERGTSTRLTVDAGVDFNPIWTPDGERVTFGSTRAGPTDIYWVAADGGESEPLVARPQLQWPTSWSPDGKWLAYTETDPVTGFDIWVWARHGEATAFLRTPFDESGAVFSPDGRWLAYTSNESSRDEVYVRAFPGPGPKLQISTEGGTEPIWARRGNELFYRSSERMMAVAVVIAPVFRAEKPRVLFVGEYQTGDLATYDVTADGEKFVMIRGEAAAAPVPLHVVLNWFEELKRRVPSSVSR